MLALLVVIAIATYLPLASGTTSLSASSPSEFVGCLGEQGEYTPKSGIKVKKRNEKRTFYECAESCSRKGNYPYSYFTDKGRGVHSCSCSTRGPPPDEYSVQPVGTFGCRLGQTRVGLTATEHRFIVCSTGLVGDLTEAGTFDSPLDCLSACESTDAAGALFVPLPAGKGDAYRTDRGGYGCRCGAVTSVRTVSACGQAGAEFAYSYKPTHRTKKMPTGTGKSPSRGAGRKKLDGGAGTGTKVEGEKKVYDDPCDDPDSILGYCGFGQEDEPVFHDRTNL